MRPSTSTKRFCCLLLCLICFQACEKPSGKLPVLDLDLEYPEKALALGDIVSDIRFVQFETTDESLLPSFFNYLIGEKYIITHSFKGDVLQFGADGKFVRVLAKKGKGPGEFVNIASMVMDNAEELLYLCHMGSNHLLVFDLDSGNPKPEIPIPDKVVRMVFVNDEEVLAFGYSFGEFERFKLNVRTSEVSEIIRNQEEKVESTSRPAPIFSSAGGNVYTLLAESDTLYQYQERRFVQSMVFKFGNQVDLSKTSSGQSMYLLLNGPDHLLLYTYGISVDRSGPFPRNSFSDDKKFFYYSKANNETFIVNEVMNDLLKTPIEDISLLRQQGEYLGMKYEAAELMSLMETNVALKNHYSKLLKGHELKEDDNPILVVGKLK